MDAGAKDLDLSLYQDELNTLNLDEDERTQGFELAYKQIKKTKEELEEDEKLKSTLTALNGIEKVEKEIEGQKDIMAEFLYPKEREEIVKKTLENVKVNEKIDDSLSYLEALDENARLIQEVENKIEQEKQKNANEEKAKEQDNKDKVVEELEAKSDEEFAKQEKQMQEEHEKELQRLKEERERLEDNFNKSLENLLNSTDLSSLLSTLMDLDKALSLIIKDAFKEVELNNKQREERLELALQKSETKEVVKGFMKELHSKNKELNEGLGQMQKEKNAFTQLDRILKNQDLDLKDIDTLERFYQNIEKELPHFKDHYPRIYEKGQKVLSSGKDKVLNKIKGQARSMV